MSAKPDRQQLVELASDAAAAAAAVAVSGYGPVLAMVAAIGQPAVAAALNDLAARGLTRVFGVSLVDSGLSADELVRRLTETDDGLRLLARAVEVAARAAHDEKLRALGRCLSAGAQDTARVDDELLLVAAIAVIEPPHIRLLRVLVMLNPKRRSSDGDVAKTATWSADEPVTVDPSLTPELTAAMLGQLTGQGLVTSASSFLGGNGSYQASRLGRLLLERSRAMSESD